MTPVQRRTLARRLLATCTALAATWALIATPAAHAGSTVYTLAALPGLDAGNACPTGMICSPAPFNFGGSQNAVSGTLTIHDDINDTVDIALTVASASMVDDPLSSVPTGGVDEIAFTSTTYTVTGIPILISGNQIFGMGDASGSVSGTYEQLFGGGTVGGPSGFGATADFGIFQCLGASCGFTVGHTKDFALSVGGTSFDFVHTFNVVIPEPNTAALLALGLVGLASARRRA